MFDSLIHSLHGTQISLTPFKISNVSKYKRFQIIINSMQVVTVSCFPQVIIQRAGLLVLHVYDISIVFQVVMNVSFHELS